MDNNGFDKFFKEFREEFFTIACISLAVGIRLIRKDGDLLGVLFLIFFVQIAIRYWKTRKK